MTSSDRFFNAANNLTLARLPLAGLIWVAPANRTLVLCITGLAGVTDVLDGWVARRASNGPHPAGAWLDPLCDKVFVLSALGAVSASRRPPPYVPFLIATREILQVPMAGLCLLWLEKSGEPVSRVDWKAVNLGKVTTAVQFLAIGAMLLRHRWTVPLAALSGVLGATASLYYFSRTWPALRSIQRLEIEPQAERVSLRQAKVVGM
jgi:phosphatidylglycerophosphate synthase